MRYIIKVNGQMLDNMGGDLRQCLDTKEVILRSEPDSVVIIEPVNVPSKYDFIDVT